MSTYIPDVVYYTYAIIYITPCRYHTYSHAIASICITLYTQQSLVIMTF